MTQYYNAYEERYKKIHEKGLLWFQEEPTLEVINWIKDNQIGKEDIICEIGCGEGRDALYLGQKGYDIVAMDVSPAAIKKCNELKKKKNLNVKFLNADILCEEETNFRFKYIYSVGTLHMLVDDNDRRKFLKRLFDMLEPSGKILLVSMGDGLEKRQTDTSKAFQLQERRHMPSGEKVMVAETSYRAVDWEMHKKELIEAGFTIEQGIITENKEYYKCMTVYLSKE